MPDAHVNVVDTTVAVPGNAANSKPAVQKAVFTEEQLALIEESNTWEQVPPRSMSLSFMPVSLIQRGSYQ